jgi:hypothetical protein
MSTENNISAEFSPKGDLDSLQTKAWIVGGIGAVALATGYFTSPDSDEALASFFGAYLVAWLLGLSIALGLLALSMLNHVSGGYWGAMSRRFSEAAGRTLPFFFLLWIPIAFNLETIYTWAQPDPDAIIQAKLAYLNPLGFRIRGVLYFAFWIFMAWKLSSLSRKHDESGDETILQRMKAWSAFGLVFHVLLSTFAAVDWVMSLDPHWFSSLFGAAFVAGQALGGFCFSVLALNFLRTREPFRGLIQTKLFHDYGKLMLAFISVWAYLSFSQYLIIWSGNLPEEITWYMERSHHGWGFVTKLVAVGHFVLPFLVLLSADLKKVPRLLSLVALWILAMRWLDYYWLVMPSLSHDGVGFTWVHLVAPFGICGIWLALLIGSFKARPPLPYRHPLLQEIANHG